MQTFEKASTANLEPSKVGQGSMAFMFESCLMLGVTEWGLHHCQKVQDNYNHESWEPLKVHFKRPNMEFSVSDGKERNGVGDGKDTTDRDKLQ